MPAIERSLQRRRDFVGVCGTLERAVDDDKTAVATGFERGEFHGGSLPVGATIVATLMRNRG
jgi:hypothetical protein